MDTVIGPNAHVTGEIRGKTNLEIHGTCESSVDIDGLLVLRKTGKLSGRSRVASAVIEGTVEGTIVAVGKIELGAGAHVVGDIQARTVAIAEGCFFEGKIHMSGQDARSFAEKRAGAQPEEVPRRS